jgi:glycosyltransferase involved in cell wall biosynthesis
MHKISVIVPVFNGSKTLTKCLQSIFSNDYNNYEVIVVNDGSTDNTVDIAKQFPCKVVSLDKNLGPSTARNTGARNAKGDVLLFLDADVTVPIDILTKANRLFEQNKDVKIIRGIYALHSSYINEISRYQDSFYYFYSGIYNNKPSNTLVSFCFAITKALYISSGGFNENIRSATAEDEEFGYKLISSGNKMLTSEDLSVIHLATYTLKSFIKRNYIMTVDTIKSFMRTRTHKDKLSQKTYIKPIVSMIFLPVIIAAFILSFLIDDAVLLYFSISLNALFILLNLDYWTFYVKKWGMKTLIKAVSITYLYIAILCIGTITGFIDYLFGNKY